MYLYDNCTPPLLDGSYRFDVSTATTIDARDQNLPSAVNYFNVEGPRFTLSPALVAGVFPPRNGHGSFQDNLPHIALGRRTLPWERALDPSNLIGTPKHRQGDPPSPVGPPPWMALLLFEEGEYTILQNQKLQDVVPPDVFQRLGRPANITCDAVQSTLPLVTSIMPSVEELTVLANVRQVNKEDRELAAGSGDGWFSVVMSNRVPAPNAKFCACLVSLEERSDIVPADPPPDASIFGLPPHDVAPVVAAGNPQPFQLAASGPQITAGHLVSHTGTSIGTARTPVLVGIDKFPFHRVVTLVLLYSWKFECIGPGSFRDLMQGLNVAMFGTVADPGHPPVADTGHIKISLGDRAGVEETVLYRSPLAPFQLTRDDKGPYHSADQCRRVTPETGAEDVTYACAFEVGRLLAAADPRLAQELMRWRREAFRQSARGDTFKAVSAAIPLPQPIDVHTPAVPVVAAGATERMLTGRSPSADPYSFNPIQQVIGLNAAAVKDTWGLSSNEEAVAILGGNAGTIGASVTAPPATSRPATTIDAVAADTASLKNLSSARDRLIANAAQKLGGKP